MSVVNENLREILDSLKEERARRLSVKEKKVEKQITWDRIYP